MYSRKVVEKRVKRASAIIRAHHNLSPRWEIIPSTNGERDEMRAHFNTLLDPRGFITRDFTREERLWVLKESTLCKLDFEYFAANYARIIDWTSKLTYFIPNKAQRIILDLMAEAEEQGFAQMYMFLKARQLGITTLWQILLGHRDFFYKNVVAYTGSSEEAKSRKMVGKMVFLWENLDWWLRPRRTAHRAGELMEFGDLGSSINVQWGNQKEGMARGDTPTIAHLSEVSTYLDPEELVEASLENAIHENPFGMLALESTAAGIGNWWHKTWKDNVLMDSMGLAKYKPVFLPWYVGEDLYPTEWDYKRRPAPPNWTPPQYIERHAEAAKVYVKSNDILKKALGSEWEMSLKQKWWYYLKYEEARRKKTIHKLLTELPASADEAFQNSNPSVFSIETMSEVRTESTLSAPVGTYQISGKNIPFIYSDQTPIGDPITDSIKATALSQDGVPLDEFTLDPLETDGWPDTNPECKLYVWEFPKPGETYGIACDPSEGVELDSSTIQVIKKATPFHPDEQVAEWASNRIAPHDLWAFIYCLAHLYTVKDHQGEWREPIVVIETNINAGDAAQTEMMKRGYSNFYREADFTQIGDIGPQFNKRPRAIRDRVGWRTTRASRPRMISLFRKMVRDGAFKVRSPFLVWEMSTLEYNIDKQRIEATEGEHDDRVMAASMLLCAWYDPEIYGTVPSAFMEQRSYEASLDKFPEYLGDKIIGRGSRAHEIERADIRDSRSLYALI